MNHLTTIISIFLLASAGTIHAWENMPMPELKVDGRFLKDTEGNIVNLHGFAQTYSPWFNEQGSKWINYDVEGCLKYNKEKIDQILAAGWKMNFVRMHMDPYWSNTPGKQTTGENDISAFDFNRFRTYLNDVFIPMAEYAVAHGLYVVMRPPGVCPEKIAVGDAYHQYLKKVWGYVSTQTRLTNNHNIMFELANEPINILGTDGQYSSNSDGAFENASKFFQEIVDLMRGNGCKNIIWVPGMAYQSQYAGYAKHPVKGENIGYAVHVYPGWYGSDALKESVELGGSYGGGFNAFMSGWNTQVEPVAEIAPIMVTEMDWAPEKYNASWGKSITGKMFDSGFGANFKYIADHTGNVSWLIFTDNKLLSDYKDISYSSGAATFLTDPEACPYPTFQWLKDYAGVLTATPSSYELTFSSPIKDGKCLVMPGSSVWMDVIAQYEGFQLNKGGGIKSVDLTGDDTFGWNGNYFTSKGFGTAEAEISYLAGNVTKSFTVTLESEPFPFRTGYFKTDIFGEGSFIESTHTITTGQYGFAGWQYSEGLDLSGSRYLIARMEGQNNAGASFRIFDKNDYWSGCAMADFGKDGRAVIDLKNLKSNEGRVMDASHIHIVGFWSYGGTPFKIKEVFLSDDPDSESGVEITGIEAGTIVDVYDLHSRKVKSRVAIENATDNLPPGIYIIGKRKVLVTH